MDNNFLEALGFTEPSKKKPVKKSLMIKPPRITAADLFPKDSSTSD